MPKRVTKGSDNVFADIGVKNADEAYIKAQIAHAISNSIETRKLTQSEAARILDIDQPKVSNLVRGKLNGFTLDRLFRFLTALGSDIEIVVKESRQLKNKPGHMKIALA